eukprot:7933658-Prorocentrum_lima.AAC.1
MAERDVAFISLMCAADSTLFGEPEEHRHFWEWARHSSQYEEFVTALATQAGGDALVESRSALSL